MQLTKQYVKELILEEMTKQEIKDLVSDTVEKQIKRELPGAVKDELAKALKGKDVKGDIGNITKKIIKKLYKDLSLHHPYIIDRIKI
jgi:uncharacterized membrane protein YheB (UPF0754 family)